MIRQNYLNIIKYQKSGTVLKSVYYGCLL